MTRSTHKLAYLHFRARPEDDVLAVQRGKLLGDDITVAEEVDRSLAIIANETPVVACFRAIAGDVNDCRVLWVLKLLYQGSDVWKKGRRRRFKFFFKIKVESKRMT